MRRLIWCILCFALASQSSFAQDVPGIEIGTRVGFNVAIKGSELLSVGIPGGSPNPLGVLGGGTSSVHVAFFPWSNIMVEPQVNLDVVHLSNGDSQTVTSANISGQIVYLFGGSLSHSPYVGLSSSAIFIDTGNTSEEDFAIGAALGYRFLVGEHLVLRPESSYRYWIDFGVEEVSVALAFSVLLK